mgnify:CR=1 FL=1
MTVKFLCLESYGFGYLLTDIQTHELEVKGTACNSGKNSEIAGL